MVATLGHESLDALINAVVPDDIRLDRPLALPAGAPEHVVMARLRELADDNTLYRSHLGMGYYDHVFFLWIFQCLADWN